MPNSTAEVGIVRMALDSLERCQNALDATWGAGPGPGVNRAGARQVPAGAAEVPRHVSAAPIIAPSKHTASARLR